jgi:hypothetical protein
MVSAEVATCLGRIVYKHDMRGHCLVLWVVDFKCKRGRDKGIIGFCGINGTAKRDICCYIYAVPIVCGYRITWYGLLSHSREGNFVEWTYRFLSLLSAKLSGAGDRGPVRLVVRHSSHETLRWVAGPVII